MKKLILAALAAGFVLTGCKKDDDDVASIVGAWKINKYTYKYANGTSDTEIPDACEAKTTITFKEGGTMISDEYYTNGSGTCTLDNSSGSYTYNENEQNLYVNLGDGTINFKVITINNSELVLAGEKDDYDSDGEDDDYTIYLKR
ncbi:lipocalin-like domain-containing protein [Chryseobacterium echinoideorum]|uniref:lipocalin family protein n=1 Tax=Chryseobacterium echinoideorum TaxID=1549648 RepID=UPI001186E217|nr:lipocalin family protein [Chryseobacterium echinoideorum]